MICPNCKTELVEVNGRFICSDCGREIPENEVMASDWGNGGTARAGLYGAGTDEVPEEGSKPITDFDASLSEIENEITTPESAPVPDGEPSVEDVLQQQAAVPDAGFYTPAEITQNTESEIENIESVGEPSPIPVIPTQEPEASPEPVIPNPEELAVPPIPDIPSLEPVTNPEQVIPMPVEPVGPVSIPEVAPITPEPVIQTPETIEPPVVVPELPPTPEVAPEQPTVAKDMFEYADAPVAPATVDPGIYADPLYENVSAVEPTSDQLAGATLMPRDKRVTMTILITGTLLVILLIAGGLWGYLALNAKVQPVEPVINLEEVTWQDQQVPEGGFKISFPGNPEKTEGALPVSGSEAAATTYMLEGNESVYTVSTALLNAEQLTASLPLLVEEVATGLETTATVTKTGKYYTADAIDFTLSSDTARYQGKLMINAGQYILVLAGSPSGNSIEYDKFIKSFAFTKAESNKL